MVRVTIKGGVWKNSEDEVLKAGVMKYGKNDWSRVASLLNRKTAKQCKARWTEWLDPRVKKIEWSRDEEEKLLHMAKLMPNQWRTIAPIVGRTAGQCMEHYEKLLDRAGASSGDVDALVDDPRRLRAGEMDPTPETKPARPDPIDMDEDEKEMLAEARARLANTQGKKAKRKARERILEESQRLAQLQKRRELKAAGLDTARISGGPTKRKFIDYANEIPYQKLPPAGFYDVAQEERMGRRSKLSTDKLDLARLEGKRSMEEKDKLENREKDRLKALYKMNAAQAVMATSEANDAGPERKRSTLALPSPNVSDRDLEVVAKLSARQGEDAFAGIMPPPVGSMMRSGPGGNSVLNDTASLLSVATGVTGLGSESTRTARREDLIAQEARNQLLMRRNLNGDDTEGDFSTDLPELQEGTGFDGSKPRAAPVVDGSGGLDVATPAGSVAGSLATTATSASAMPLRDQFRLNTVTGPADDMVSVSDLGSVSSFVSIERRRNLVSQLKKLPEPEYTYDMAVPEVAADDGGSEKKKKRRADRGDEEDERRREEALAAEVEAASRSSAVRRNLPRPVEMPDPSLGVSSYTGNDEACRSASALINTEMLSMVAWDVYRFPYTSTSGAGALAPRRVKDVPVEPPKFHPSQLDKARELIAAQQIEPLPTLEDFTAKWEAAHEKLDAGMASDELALMQMEVRGLVRHSERQAAKMAKLESKIQVKTGGYRKIAAENAKALLGAMQQCNYLEHEEGCFTELQAQEKRALARRLHQERLAAEAVATYEAELQGQYAALQRA